MMFSEKILIGTKEAGAAAYFAALLRGSKKKLPAIYAYPKASKVFAEQNIQHHVIRPGLKASKLLDELRPFKVYVSMSLGDTFEKRLLVEAKRRNIPVFVFLDSYLNLWQRFADHSGQTKWYYMPDRIFVINNLAKSRIVSQGVPAKMVSILKHPLLNVQKVNVKAPLKYSREQVIRKLQLPRNCRLILFVSEYRFRESKKWRWDQPSPKDLPMLLRIAANAARIASEQCGVPAYVIVKKHPAENFDRINTLPARLRPFCKSVGAFDKQSLIHACSIVTGLTSVLLSEASEHNKFVFSYHHHPSDKSVWFSTINPKIKEMKSPQDCTRVILKALLANE